MSRTAPLQFLTVSCKHCGAIVALLPPGTILHTTRLRCVHCETVRIVYAVDSKQAESSAALLVANP